jgi:hypothetical protein
MLASLTNVIYNSWRNSESDPTTIDDWLPKYDAWITSPKPRAEQLSAEYDAWLAAQQKKQQKP